MIYLHVCLYSMYMPHSHRGLELNDSELHVSAQSQTLVLWKKSQCSLLLGHLPKLLLKAGMVWEGVSV